MDQYSTQITISNIIQDEYLFEHLIDIIFFLIHLIFALKFNSIHVDNYLANQLFSS